MKKLIYSCTIIVFITMGSCKEDGNSQYNLDISIGLSVLDENGTDLLNPSNPSAYSENNIKIFYLIEGQKEEIFKPNLDNPRMFFIYENEETGKYVMNLGPNDALGDEYPITYIQWDEKDTDTLKCEFARGDNFTITTKVWLNDSVIWDVNGDNFPDIRYAEIIKTQ